MIDGAVVKSTRSGNAISNCGIQLDKGFPRDDKLSRAARVKANLERRREKSRDEIKNVA